jgi:crossover junction endodeoxyribonuclease RuvC
MKILGVDPGSYNCGLAGINTKPRLRLAFAITLRLPQKENLIARIDQIDQELERLTTEYQPDLIACEGSYAAKNMRATKVLSQIAGTVAMHAYRHHLPYNEFAPASVKKTVCGSGRATKKEVITAVKAFLPPDQKELSLDEHRADAVAVAIHQWTVSKRAKVLAQVNKRSKA